MNKNIRKQIFAFIVFVLLVILAIYILKPFIVALFWMTILATVTMPVMQWLKAVMRGRAIPAAIMLSVTWVIFLSIIFINLSVYLYELAPELQRLKTLILTFMADGKFHEYITDIPIIGDAISRFILVEIQQSAIKTIISFSSDYALGFSATISGIIINMGLVFLLLPFAYIYGKQVSLAIGVLINNTFNFEIEGYLNYTRLTVSGVFVGVLGTALCQAVLTYAALYWLGVSNAGLLSVSAFIFSIIPPFGAAIVWLPVSIWLASNGNLIDSSIMFLWGFFVISGVDNIIKPYLISKGNGAPFILILFGILGGLLAFGLAGVFIGPVVLSLTYKVVDDVCRISGSSSLIN